MNDWPKIVPWLEVNRGTATELAGAKAGLARWPAITDKAIVSTEPGRVKDVYPTLCAYAQKIGLTIIPGMKGSPVFGSREDTQLDKFDAWQRFGTEVRAAIKATGSSTILLEMESASKPVIYGRAPFGWGAYGACIHHLPADISVIWYPTVWSGDPLVRGRQVKLCELAGGALRGRILWTDLTINRPDDVHASTRRLMTARLDAFELDYSAADAGRFKIVYTHASIDKYWPFEQIVEAVKLVHPPDTVLFYPHSGSDNWAGGSRQIVTRLLKAGYPQRE